MVLTQWTLQFASSLIIPCAEELSLDGGAEAAWSCADDEDALAGAHAAALVHLVAGPLVELGPHRLRLPRTQLGL